MVCVWCGARQPARLHASGRSVWPKKKERASACARVSSDWTFTGSAPGSRTSGCSTGTANRAARAGTEGRSTKESLMGEIVAAVGTCHTPYMFTRPPDENPEQLNAASAGMAELGKVLDETNPDVIIFFGSDHVETFSVTCVPTFAIIAGSRAIAKFAGREYSLPVHREMAEDLLDKLVVDHDFDLAYSEDAELGHAFAVPFEHVIGKRDIPIIPFLTNVYVPPLPTPKRCAALGRAIAQIIEGRKERVALIASGGMSHFPGTSKYLSPEFDFDRWLVAQFEVGNIDALLNMTGTQLDEVGNTEMLTWSLMFGAIGSRAGTLIEYIPTWHHGLAMMRFLPATGK